MGEVQPIRERKKIREMDTYLRGKSDRDHILWYIGIHTGMRVSDIVKLQAKDLDPGEKIEEKKTGKKRMLYANDKVQRELRRYVNDQGIRPDGWLFPSRRSDGSGHISEVQAYRILRSAGKAVGLEHIGTHTMRKTFGYHFYKKTQDIVMLMRIFNHSSPSITLRYIGLEQEEIAESLTGFYLL